MAFGQLFQSRHELVKGSKHLRRLTSTSTASFQVLDVFTGFPTDPLFVSGAPLWSLVMLATISIVRGLTT